jgi:hypothetical protein
VGSVVFRHGGSRPLWVVSPSVSTSTATPRIDSGYLSVKTDAWDSL